MPCRSGGGKRAELAADDLERAGEPPADRVGETHDAEKAACGKAADGHHEPRSQEPKLPVEPEPAQLDLARRRHPVAATRRALPGVAARRRHAVERLVEGVLVEVEPAAERAPGATAPRSELL